MSKPQSAGYIQLQYFDKATNTIIPIGGAGFESPEEVEAAWANIPNAGEGADFMADRLDDQQDIVDDKPVTAEICEQLMSRSISELIAEGSANLKEELARLGADAKAG